MIRQIWILLCGTLVFFMQAGFTCYEAGFVQSKNVIAVSIENLLTFMITTGVYTFIGLPVMYQTTIFHMSSDQYGQVFLQIMLTAVATTIFAGAMSERSKLSALLIASFLTASVIYPVFGRWVWGMNLGGQGAWLNHLGFMDFAGATVIHTTAGFVTLAGLLIVGKRENPKTGKSNIPLATLGVFILWFGWLGFNGGSMHMQNDMIGLVFLNTTLAASFGMLGALLFNLLVKRKGRYLISIFNGVLAGLVAITAMSGYCLPQNAVLVGLIAGMLADASTILLEKFKIDDVVNAIPAHLVGGIAGTLLLPVMIQKQYLLCQNRLEQLGAQTAGLLVNLVWTLGLSYFMFWLIEHFLGIRVNSQEEKKGLNIVEFNDLYSWENYMEISSYETEINEKNKLLRKQSRLLTVTEQQEKENLARELHDGLGQSLAALKLILKLHPDEGSQQALDLTETSITEMRNVLNDLKPACLDQGLEEGLQFLVNQYEKVKGLHITLDMNQEPEAFDDAVKLNLYRIVQEAVHNGVQHGKASKIQIQCQVISGETFQMTVTDNGVGFTSGQVQKGQGLDSIQDRARMLGGMATVESQPGKGTTCIVRVPIHG